jgi:CheY-like chemotaxis protein
MKTLLAGWHCSVHTAAGIRAALAILYDGKVQPDILLVDYHLDDGNGLDAISSIRVRLGSQIPAVLVTADTSPDLAREARLYASSLLRKPVRPAQLRAVINQLARQRTIA